jgi:hypothetical protein
MSRNYPWWVSVTYLIYLTLWGGSVFGATYYVVFELGHSGWWFAFAVFLASASIQPRSWAALANEDALKAVLAAREKENAKESP